MAFLNALAWSLGILFGLIFTLRLFLFVCYTSTSWGKLEQLNDTMKGKKATFPLFYPFLISLVCWLWVIFGGR